MGVFADILAGGVQVPAAAPRIGQDRVTGQVLRNAAAVIDPTAVGSGFAAVNEVQSIPTVTADAGTYTITINLYGGVTYTTAALARTANAATIQAALDTASPSSIGDGHIVVSGGNISTAPIVLTFSGASVAGKNHGLSTVTSSLTNSAVPVSAPTVTVSATGNPERKAIQALFNLGIITGTLPAQGATPSDWAKNRLLKAPRACVIRDLALEAAREEGNDAIYTTIATLYNLPANV